MQIGLASRRSAAQLYPRDGESHTAPIQLRGHAPLQQGADLSLPDVGPGTPSRHKLYPGTFFCTIKTWKSVRSAGGGSDAIREAKGVGAGRRLAGTFAKF